MRIRDAEPRDVAVLAALEKELFGPDAWSDAVVAAEVEGPGRHSLVAVEDDDVVGYAVTQRSAAVADLQRIAVRPDVQRRGVARALLEELLARVRGEGADRVLLEVGAANTAALGLYAAFGFVEIDRRRRYYRDGTDAVVMRRSLGRGACGGRG